MSKTDSLFELVGSLSKSEKRHLRMVSSLYKGNKNHMKLLKAVEWQFQHGRYDESLIKKEFAGEPFTRQLHVAKNYLKGLILKSLRQVHLKSSVDTVLKDNLRDLEILFNKGLYRQCWSLLNKGKRLAIQYEKFPAQLELLNWQRNLILIDKGTFAGIGEVAQVIEEEWRIMEKQRNLNEYWGLCINLIQENFAGRGEALKPKINQEPLLTNPDLALSYQAKRMYFFTNYVVCIFHSEIDQAYEHAWAGINFIESHPHQIEEDPLTFVATINNLVPLCFQLGKYEEARTLIDKIKSIPETYQLPNFENLYYRIFVRTLNNELELYRDLSEIDLGIELGEEVNRFINRFDKVLSNDYRMLFHYQLAYFNFADGRYSDALSHLNPLLGERNDPRTDIQSYARVLNLMVHYELKNYDLIEYLCRSTRRFLDKKNRLYGFEKAILEFFKRAGRTENLEAIANLKSLKKKILALEEDQSESLDYINILVWIQSKLNRDTFKNTLISSKRNEVHI